MSKILIIEDDVALATWMADYLRQHDYDVVIEHDGANAVDTIQLTSPDMIILDINLPNKNGFDICKQARAFYHSPILMVTANDEEFDEVLGLELGADDYLTKPVTPRVLLARIKSQLRRGQQAHCSSNKMVFDTLTIDLDNQSVLLSGKEVNLSSAEFELLWVLAKHAGHEIKRQDLVKEIRGFDYDGFDRSIDVRVSRLRKKLNDLENPPNKIKTIWGKGYLFVKTAWK